MKSLFHSLGYIGVTSPRSDDWPAFATEVFGMEVTSNPDGTQRMRWDDHAYRLAVHPGDDDRLAYLGWEVPDSAHLAHVVESLQADGIDVQSERAELAAERQVREVVWFRDPFGFRHEVFTGPLIFDRSFRGTRSTTRFITGSQGLGHAVLVVPDLDLGMNFYQRVMGLKCTDIVHHGGALGTMAFLRCNTRHHSVALWAMEQPQIGLQHIMVESADSNEVGRAYDVMLKGPWQISATLGRHVGDEQMSFYARTPGGFDLELGCESIDIDDAVWSMRLIDKTAGAPNEVWGHHWQNLGPQASIRAYEGTP